MISSDAAKQTSIFARYNDVTAIGIAPTAKTKTQRPVRIVLTKSSAAIRINAFRNPNCVIKNVIVTMAPMKRIVLQFHRENAVTKSSHATIEAVFPRSSVAMAKPIAATVKTNTTVPKAAMSMNSRVTMVTVSAGMTSVTASTIVPMALMSKTVPRRATSTMSLPVPMVPVFQMVISVMDTLTVLITVMRLTVTSITMGRRLTMIVLAMNFTAMVGVRTKAYSVTTWSTAKTVKTKKTVA